MSSYFDEHNCRPHSPDAESNLYLSLARMLQDMGFESQVLSVLESQSDRKPPASQQFIKSLKKVEVLGNESEKCCVCLKEFVRGETVGLDCSHKFHIQCITPWLQMHNSCPLCRFEFPTDDEEYERNKRERLRKEATIRQLHESMFT